MPKWVIGPLSATHNRHLKAGRCYRPNLAGNHAQSAVFLSSRIVANSFLAADKVSFRVDGYMTVTRRLHPELVEFVTSHG